jgi:hypothetical protein
MNFRNRYFQDSRAAWLICAASLILALLPGSVRAQGEKGVGNKSRDLKIGKLPAPEKRWALIIGVNNVGLQGAANDAKALRNTLIKYAGFPARNITLLTTDDDKNLPTRSNIISALNNLGGLVAPDGLFLFAFSGHGKTVRNNAYIVPADIPLENGLDVSEDQLLNSTLVKREIAEMKVRQVLVILDSCRKIDPEGAKGKAGEPLRPVYRQKFSFEKANEGIDAYVTLFGTSEGSFAYEYFDDETKQYRGYFSRALEKGLSGEAANPKGEVMLGGLVSYLEKNVPINTFNKRGVRQIPWKSSDGYRESELVLAVVDVAADRKADPGIRNEGKKILQQNRLSIISPKDGEEVDITSIVSGKTPYADRSHYIVVTPVRTGETWIMKKLDDPDDEGTWTGIAFFGDEKNGGGQKFIVRVFATADSKIPEGKLKDLPRDAVFSAAITVKRRE